MKAKLRIYLFSFLIGMLPLPALYAKVEKAASTPVQTLSKEDLQKVPVADTVTVISSRIPTYRTSLYDVPSNITYRSSNITYKNQGALNLVKPLTFQDSVQDTEGAFFYDQSGNGRDTTVGIRGFSGSGDTVFLVDGVRVNEVDGNVVNYPLLSMNDVESIQLDRGSASPIYGSGAFGGVVNLTTGTPSPKRLSVFGGLEVSSFHGINFNQGFSGTLHDQVTPLHGKWSYYFNGGRDVSRGFRDNGESRVTSFNIKTAYELPDQQGRIYVGVKPVSDAISNPGELTFQQYQDDQDRSNKPLDGRDFQSLIVYGGADKKFWDDKITASVLASVRKNRIHFFNTFGTFTDFPDGFNPDTNLVTVWSRDKNFTWQTTYQDKWKEIAHETLLGMEFRNGDSYSTQDDAFQGKVTHLTTRETDLHANPYNTALFWRETMKISERVIPYFGMRHDYNWLKTSDNLNPAQSLSRRWHDSTLSTGLTVKPLDWMDLFGNYSQGFRVPEVSEIAPFSGTISTNLAPEKSDSYEAGSRLRYKDFAKLKTSYFLIDLKDEIVFDSTSVSTTAPFGQNINIGRSRRYGTELRLDLDPVKEVNLYGGYTWTRAYVAETDAGGSLVDGRSLGQIPENRFAFGSYVRPLARFGELYEGLRIGLNGVFVGHQHPQNYESTSQAVLNATGGAGHFIKSYSLWNFVLSYTWREKEVYFKINNVFDEKYYSRSVSATSFGTAIYPAGTFNFVNPGAPREFVLGSKWAF